ncbi:hypothetical protein ACFR9U_16310 [Halorientalis brevis]|uniref:Uncharacterized protein n=1 Tax=Halorientalis brevis TaxID=1126241 RepID=A0ABD6CE22_9EURY|nr:hypothetical protein [Halorientalis brevis]
MTDYETSSEKTVAQRAGVIGYDQRGRCHRWDPVRATLYVTIDGEVVHTEQLSRPAVRHWIEYVRDEKCGWIDEWWQCDDLGESKQRHRAAKAQAADIRYNLAIEGGSQVATA